MKRKLVRDRIPELITENGQEPDYYIANKNEYLYALYDKMNEEMEEFIQDPCIEEAADVLEVFLSIIDYHDMLPIDVFSAGVNKRMTRGGFKERYILSIKDDVVSREDNDCDVPPQGEKK